MVLFSGPIACIAACCYLLLPPRGTSFSTLGPFLPFFLKSSLSSPLFFFSSIPHLRGVVNFDDLPRRSDVLISRIHRLTDVERRKKQPAESETLKRATEFYCDTYFLAVVAPIVTKIDEGSERMLLRIQNQQKIFRDVRISWAQGDRRVVMVTSVARKSLISNKPEYLCITWTETRK